MVRDIFRKLLFISTCLVLMLNLYLLYDMFFHAEWLVIFGENHRLIHVHSWENSDMVEIVLIIIVSSGIYWLAYKTWFPKMKPKESIVFRKSITVITGFVVLLNILFIYNVLFHKHWDISEMMEYDGIFLTVAYFTGEILILTVLIAFQTGLGILTYRAWVTKPRQPQAT